MHKTFQDTSSQGNKKAWFLGGITFFSLLLFLSIGLVIMAQDGLKDFYSKKLKELDGVSLEAVMPISSDNDKILNFLDETSYKKITYKDALATDDTRVRLHETITTNLLIQNSSNSQLHYTEGSKGSNHSAVLPYILKSYYGLKLKDEITLTIGGETLTYSIAGFYEDEILSQQNIRELLMIYLDSNAYEDIRQKDAVEEARIYSIQLVDPKKTKEVMEAWTQALEEELFIDGVDLMVYGGHSLADNINLYLHYAKKICFSLGMVFFAAAAVGLMMMVQNLKKYIPMRSKQSSLLCLGIGIGTLIIGNVILFLVGPEILSYLISSLGYEFHIGSVLVCVLIGSLVYVIMEALLIGIGLNTHTIRKEVIPLSPKKQSLLSICKTSVLAVFAVSIIVTTLALIVTRLYSNTIGEMDLFYEYNELEEVIEVFHFSLVDNQHLSQFAELTDYAKPMIQFVVLGSLIALALVYGLVISRCLERSAERLRRQGERNIRSQALPILGFLLLATLLAFVIAIVLTQLCMAPVNSLLRQWLGLSLDQLRMNVAFSMMVLGGFAIVASGVTLMTVR